MRLRATLTPKRSSHIASSLRLYLEGALARVRTAYDPYYVYRRVWSFWVILLGEALTLVVVGGGEPGVISFCSCVEVATVRSVVCDLYVFT